MLQTQEMLMQELHGERGCPSLGIAGCAAAGGIARERRVRESGDGVTGQSDADLIEGLFSIPFPPGDYTVSSG